MRRKIVAILLLIVFTSCFYFSVISQATSLTEQKTENENKKQEAEQQLEYVKEELSEAIVKVQQLEDSIKQAESEIGNMEKELSELQGKVDETTEKLNKVQKNYEENELLLEERLVILYEAGDTTYLDILLKSSNIVDFLSKYYTIEQIVQNDVELLEEIAKEKQEIETAKNKLEVQKAELKVLRAKKQQAYIVMENNKVLLQNEVSKLSEEEQELQQKIQDYKKEEERIENLIKLATDSYIYNGEYTGGLMAWPVAKSGTYITSAYGIREHPIQGVIKMHTGIDIGGAGFGAPIIAAADGVVSYAGYNGGYGNCVIVNHGNGISTLYGHGQKILTTVGTEVKQGDLIMEVGSTGNSTGPHLHFEVRVNGSCVNPMPYLQSQ